ncbi:unnamed protein product [Caenorhabditis angaria]|uniref:Uncharacterized protein n=1 Tax=Caenorhabditis angaria TaxID=860376 RepID=A0A9P1I5D8_9PELO|nr:unnamed protein product [Caenorhabditis angaria]
MSTQRVPLVHFRQTYFPETIFGDSLDLREPTVEVKNNFAVPFIPFHRRCQPLSHKQCKAKEKKTSKDAPNNDKLIKIFTEIGKELREVVHLRNFLNSIKK